MAGGVAQLHQARHLVKKEWKGQGLQAAAEKRLQSLIEAGMCMRRRWSSSSRATCIRQRVAAHEDPSLLTLPRTPVARTSERSSYRARTRQMMYDSGPAGGRDRGCMTRRHALACTWPKGGRDPNNLMPYHGMRCSKAWQGAWAGHAQPSLTS